MPLLKVCGLSVHFPVMSGTWPQRRRQTLRAVDGVDLSIAQGETLAIVGESGCGKSTLARTLVGLQASTAGDMTWRGESVLVGGRAVRPWPRRDIQMIFQDPLASLDPRMTLFKLIAEPLTVHEPGLSHAEVTARVCNMMDKVGLPRQAINRYPHEFSGGQCQRIGIARALVCRPRLLICDEPVSALDVSIRAQIINLLMALQQEFGLALLFIGHDLAIVRHIADRVLVMYLGRPVELGPKTVLYDRPAHPYTQMLLAAVPVPDPGRRSPPARRTLVELPSPMARPAGCAFAPRCSAQTQACHRTPPPSVTIGPGHDVACYHNVAPHPGHFSD